MSALLCPPLFFGAGQRSNVELLRGRRESLGHGNEASGRSVLSSTALQ